MAQDYFKLNGVTVRQPTAYSPSISTTSTDDSGRNQYLVMRNIPIGSVASYSLEWQNLTAAEMSVILTQVLNKSSFTAHYFDIVDGTWKDGTFYATTFNSPVLTLVDGEERWDSLSFNMIGVNPV